MTHLREPSDPKTNAENTDFVRAAVQNQREKMRAELEKLVRIPSVSDPAFEQTPVQDSAQAVARMLREVGMPHVEIVSAAKPDGTQGAPAVLAHRPAQPGAKTVLLYAHHDVQPPGDAGEWETPVFEPVERDGRIYGRGAADDKAGIVAHLAALRVFLDPNNPSLDSGTGITVLIEGEEEIGSPSMSAFLEKYHDRLDADAVIIADSINAAVGVPAFTTSLRGLVDLVVEVRTLEQAGHSGLFGGPAPDALTVLARLLATLHDENGDVAVAGLVESAEPEAEISERDWRRDARVLPGVELMGTGSLTRRLWAAPAIAVLGIDAPAVAGAANILVPSASAKLSLRIPAGEDPKRAAELLKRHLRERVSFGAEVTVRDGELGKPFSAAGDSEEMRIARESYAAAWGRAVEEIGIGASIPVVADFAQRFPEATILVTGVEDPGSNAHSPNESVDFADLLKVAASEVLFLNRLGAHAAPDPKAV